MKEGHSSWTAQLVTFFRSLETLRPESERLFNDPLAEKLLDFPYTPISRRNTNASIARFFLTLGPFATFYNAITARTRYIDDCIERCITDGAGQLVILGAGFDTRPFRMGGLLKSVKVFEVDFPGTQQVKVKKLENVGGLIHDGAIFVPLDFEKDDLRLKLLDRGYDPGIKTLFIWEGVTMYLTPEAVDETLAFVNSSSPAGSSIVFTYSPKSRCGGRALKDVSAIEQMFFKVMGEPQIFGIDRDNLSGFLLERGFTLNEDLSGGELIDRYINMRSWKWKADRGSIAHAIVAPLNSM
ncbi:MAG: SAM-dependent methyltransferase [Actinobacteria bacterium]|nr:SAM-dependent methyltransferase [Actinomycetota bacterium]